jgi:hypothetical protein
MTRTPATELHRVAASDQVAAPYHAAAPYQAAGVNQVAAPYQAAVVDQVAASHLPHMPLLEETFFAADPCV